jgi:hypothetical protein
MIGSPYPPVPSSDPVIADLQNKYAALVSAVSIPVVAVPPNPKVAAARRALALAEAEVAHGISYVESKSTLAPAIVSVVAAIVAVLAALSRFL